MSRKKQPNRVVQYRLQNEAWLEEKAREEGVTVLESGVILKRLEEGRGKMHPKPSSMVYVHYSGRLIDGTVFDSTHAEDGGLPALFCVRDLIMGWQIALVRMYEGDRYEVCIPAKWAYGATKLDGIPAWSTLLFELELVKIM